MSLSNAPITKDGHTDVAERLPNAGNQSDGQQGNGQQISTGDGQTVNLGLNAGNLKK